MMRGTNVPFLQSSDVSTTPGAYKVPQANASGTIDPSWFSIAAPTGGTRLYGVIDSPLPNLASSVRAVGYDTGTDQVFIWNGSRWILWG